jgi:peptide/nickel transport system ATP-binding protein
MSEPLLQVQDLRTTFQTDTGTIIAVDGVSFEIGASQTVGLVGESGCGKSVTAMSIMGLVRPPGSVDGGTVRFKGRDLRNLPESEMRRVRGNEISMVFQEPMSSLNPVLKIGEQLAEGLMLHRGLSARAARARAVELLDLVHMAEPAKRLDDYPHQYSGGMRQRIMIAMALACDPVLLIADEPTTALDVTVQAQILALLRELKRELGMSVLIITHDLGVVAETCDAVNVMYAGRIVERGTWPDMFDHPTHPYTAGLLASVPSGETSSERLTVIPGDVPDPRDWPNGCRFAPRCHARHDRCEEYPPLFQIGHQEAACWLHAEGAPSISVRPPEAVASEARVKEEEGSTLLRLEGIETHIPIRRGLLRRQVGTIRAVDGVDLEVRRGETVGLVGESGSGKSTLARNALRLQPTTAGRIVFDGQDITDLGQRQLRGLRPRMQMVFQDPVSSLNPRLRVGSIIGEALTVHGITDRRERREKVAQVLDRVGLRPDHVSRYPHEFSGGQRQRIGIARAVALNPDLIVADEPVSALDVSVQAQVLNLLADLRDELGMSYLFIAHNLSVVRHISDRVAVMYLGRIVEVGPTADLYDSPLHPYTWALLSAVPEPDPGIPISPVLLQGDVPSPIDPPSGCRFRTRCPLARAKGTVDGICAEVDPPLAPAGEDRLVACHFPGERP